MDTNSYKLEPYKYIVFDYELNKKCEIELEMFE